MLSRSSRNSSSRLFTRNLPGGAARRAAVGDGRRGTGHAAVSRRSAGAHSDVRLAVVPLSGEVGSGEPPPLDIYAKRSKNVRSPSSLNDGVNRVALLRRAAESFRAERHAGTAPPHSPKFSMAAHATLSRAQVFGYIAERTRGSDRHTKGDDVNRWRRQIRVKMVWLPETTTFERILPRRAQARTAIRRH